MEQASEPERKQGKYNGSIVLVIAEFERTSNVHNWAELQAPSTAVSSVIPKEKIGAATSN